MSLRDHEMLDVIRALHRAHRDWMRYAKTEFLEYDLTTAHFDILTTLGNTDGYSLTELSVRTLRTTAGLSTLVDRMECAALVERRPCDDDGRVVHVRLTERGQEIFADCFPRHLAQLDKILGVLTADERAELCRLLGKVSESFDAERRALLDACSS